MSIANSLQQKVVGQIRVDPANGYIAPLGIEYPDGTTQITAFPSRTEPTFQVTFASDAATAGPGGKDNPAVTTTFSSPYEDKAGGWYMVNIRGAIGGGSTSWQGGGNETITVRVRVKLNGSGGQTSIESGWVGTITKSFATTQLPNVGFQTQFQLAALPAGDNWESATLNFGMGSSDTASTSTIQRTSFTAYFYKLS